MGKFDFYQIVGVIAPGILLQVGLGLLFPEISAVISLQSLTFGDLGIWLILAYIGGNLVQSVGNLLEKLWWKMWGGWPTDWVRSEKRVLISPNQSNLLRKLLAQMLHVEPPTRLSGFTQMEWASIVRQVHAEIVTQSSSERVFIFNSSYGLNRGVMTVLLLLSGASVLRGAPLCVALSLIATAGLALLRMHRFGVLYARELFTQYLALDRRGVSPNRD